MRIRRQVQFRFSGAEEEELDWLVRELRRERPEIAWTRSSVVRWAVHEMAAKRRKR